MTSFVGERVLINTDGDIRVRPTVFEVNLHTSESSETLRYTQHLSSFPVPFLHVASKLCIEYMYWPARSPWSIQPTIKTKSLCAVELNDIEFTEP